MNRVGFGVQTVTEYVTRRQLRRFTRGCHLLEKINLRPLFVRIKKETACESHAPVCVPFFLILHCLIWLRGVQLTRQSVITDLTPPNPLG